MCTEMLQDSNWLFEGITQQSIINLMPLISLHNHGRFKVRKSVKFDFFEHSAVIAFLVKEDERVRQIEKRLTSDYQEGAPSIL